MARARRSKSTAQQRSSRTRAGGSAGASSVATLTCPECGREFTRPASLGAHRNRAHGVAGNSTRARRTRSGARKRGANSAATSRRAVSTTTLGGSAGQVDRDALLKTLFPKGLPPRESVIRELTAWLDEAERLAKLR
jgi:uncharacterized C2H2 Zn-finger protein